MKREIKLSLKQREGLVIFMKQLQIIKKAGIVLLTAIVLILSMPVLTRASAAIDINKTGSVTIDMSKDGNSVSGMSFTIYRVAELINSGAYKLTNEFQDSGVQLNQMSTASQMLTASKTLANFAADRNITGNLKTVDTSGVVKFEQLPLGYYLVVQTDTIQNQKLSIYCDPFLLAVPITGMQGGHSIYDVVAYPKTDSVCGAVILEKCNPDKGLLSGAIFRLDEKVYETNESSIPASEQTETDSQGKYYWKTLVSGITTNQYGQIVVKNISYGSYRFIETAAPNGYNLDAAPHEFSITASGTVVSLDGQYSRSTGAVQTITVINTYKTNGTSTTGSTGSSSVPNTSVNPTDANPINTNPTDTVKNSDNADTKDPKVDSGTEEDPGVIDMQLQEEDPIPLGEKDKENPEASEDTLNKKDNTGDGRLDVQKTISNTSVSAFNLPKTGGSIAYALCTYGGMILIICGGVIFVISRKKS